MGLFRRRVDEPAAVADGYRRTVATIDELGALATKCQDPDLFVRTNALYALTGLHGRYFVAVCRDVYRKAGRPPPPGGLADVDPGFLLLGPSSDGVYAQLLTELSAQLQLDPDDVLRADACRRSFEYAQWLRRQLGDLQTRLRAGADATSVAADVASLCDMAKQAQDKRAKRGFGDPMIDAELEHLAAEAQTLSRLVGQHPPDEPGPPSAPTTG